MVYRQVDAAGRITYTDRPDMSSPQGAATGAASDVAIALASNTAIASHGAAVTDAREAARRLERAERERKLGVGRLPVEKARGADASALNARYQRRQEKLRRFHEQAQRRAAEAGRLVRSMR
jgi:hypothetical protein